MEKFEMPENLKNHKTRNPEKGPEEVESGSTLFWELPRKDSIYVTKEDISSRPDKYDPEDEGRIKKVEDARKLAEIQDTEGPTKALEEEQKMERDKNSW